MTQEKYERGDIVSYWNYMATDARGFSQMAFCFAKVIHQADVWVTLETERGQRIRRQPWGLRLAPEGAEYFHE